MIFKQNTLWLFLALAAQRSHVVNVSAKGEPAQNSNSIEVGSYRAAVSPVMTTAVISPVTTTPGSRSDPSNGQGSNIVNAAENPFERDLDSDMQTFKLKHNLKQDTSLTLLTIEKDNTITLPDGRVYGLRDLEVMDVYASDAQYILDGEPMALPSVKESRTWIGNVGGDTVMITKGKSGDIRTLDIFGPDGSDQYMATVIPGMLAIIRPDDLDRESLKKFTSGDMATINGDEEEEQHTRALAGPGMLAIIRPDDLDRESLKKFTSGDMAAINGDEEEEQHTRALAGAPQKGRYLRAQHREGTTDGADVVVEGRSLQSSGCSSFRVIEVAAAFDSTFCAKEGGGEATRQEVERIIGRASVMYQQQGVCVKLVITHLEGYCTESQDPYRSGINFGDIGCYESYGLLQAFEDYWEANRGDVRRDAAHLFYARDLAGGAVGCAGVGSLCGSSYGVNEMEFSTDQQRRGIVFAHELGHNIGLDHVESANGDRYIMDSVGFGTHIWDPSSLNALAKLLPFHSCVSTEQQQNDFLTLRSEADTTMCFDLQGGDTTNGSRIWLHPCNGTPAQQWAHDSQHRLRSAIDTNKCVVGNGGSTSAGTFLMLWDCLDNDTRYAFDRYTDGSMRPRDDNTICADVASEQLLDGRPTIVFWNCHGETNQVWRW